MVPASSGRIISRTVDDSVTLVITSRSATGVSLTPITRSETVASLRAVGARGSTVSQIPSTSIVPGYAFVIVKVSSSTTPTEKVLL